MAVWCHLSARQSRRLGLLAVLTLMALLLLPAQGRAGVTRVEAAEGDCPCSLFPDTAVPGLPNDPDPDAARDGIEVGVRFIADTDGVVNGIRFYRGSANSGLHIGSLWTAGGTRIGLGLFRRETATGWQTLLFSEPVRITANATYVASYHTNLGAYSSDAGFFDTPFDASHLHASAGVFAYGDSRFPLTSFDATNYWVDVLFDTVVRPRVTRIQPAPGSIGAGQRAAIVGGFNELIDGSTLRMEVRAPDGSLVPGTFLFAPGTGSAVFSVAQPLQLGTTYRATITQAVDLAGHAMAPFTWSFTTASPCPCPLVPATAAPSQAPSDDGQAIEVGVPFRANVEGAVAGVRFYKQAGNDGVHDAHLWTSSGDLLATATFADETASGWQEALFPTPVPVSTLGSYRASYHTDTGHYSETDDGLLDFPGYPNLSVVPVTSTVGGYSMGVFEYGPSGTFPTRTFRADDYWVAPIYVPTVPITASPTATIFGQLVTLTATVATATGATPAGSVAFFAGGRPLGTAPVDGANPGHATFTTIALPPGTQRLTAVFTGAGGDFAAPASSTTVSVTGATTTTSVTMSPAGSASAGQPVTFTIRVAPVAPASGVPTGQVTIIDGESGDLHATLHAEAGGNAAVAELTATTLHGGSHFFVLHYPGDGGFAASGTAIGYTINA